MIPFLLYLGFFILSFVAVRAVVGGIARTGFSSLKTVTFGDESAVVPDRRASILSVIALFLLWGSFTGSALLPSFLHMPGPAVGEFTFEHTVQDADGNTDDATVTVLVYDPEVTEGEPEVPTVDPGDGFAKNDAMIIETYDSELARLQNNDELTRDDGTNIIAVNGEPITPGGRLEFDFGSITMSTRGSLNIAPDQGLQMEPIWLPPPEAVVSRLFEIANDGFRNFTLLEHLGYSLFRVVVGFAIGAAVGIPLGYAMGLSNWFRGWFDPIVEFMRPVPPLALIPLVIIWAGIGETGKIVLLFLAALWIMAIAARAGVSGVNITKVHAAYSLGASKWQIMRTVIIPNSLPEIFTGARVAMGVCWGTVVAAELVAAEQGAGMMIMTASRFQNTDIVILGIILIGVIGFGIDILMRIAERYLVPWKGKS
ncbi:ABC transporter permease [Pontivivens insulae]|uniref:Aliphatic sulfonates transport permease protein SsuC n=1 Tax=Pontivivens insulae TaxID=1639689 RepID=A0A2R8A898_9RHOB|nr:ABC transporter permease subunit [Pontivivens insulae]RED18362.1 taurine transport system permease protein [Pontivivens insulae]SPF28260.1 Putative aliphatic sulfonates transport permease protein SsuC [Pontivivens insulae]